MPAFSVELESGEQIIPIANGHERTVMGRHFQSDGCAERKPAPGVSSRLADRAEGDSSHCGSAATNSTLSSRCPGSLKEGHAQVRAVLTAGGKSYSEGYTLVTREDLASAYYYQPAVQRVSIVDVKVPKV